MTEAFVKWCESLQMYSEHVQGEAHFWLSAFVQEVERRQRQSSPRVSYQSAYFEVIRDFGLDGEK